MTRGGHHDDHPGRTVLCNKVHSPLVAVRHARAVFLAVSARRGRGHTVSSDSLTPAASLPQSDETATHYKSLHYKGNGISTTKYNVVTFLPKVWGRPVVYLPALLELPAQHDGRVPLQGLYEQFRRVANLYFVCVAALSLTPFSPVSAVTTWCEQQPPWRCRRVFQSRAADPPRPLRRRTPLIIVIGISMTKEAVEDYKRYKQDQQQARRPASGLRPAGTGSLTRPAPATPRAQNNSLVDVLTAHGERQPATWSSLRPGDIVRVKRDDFFPADLLFITSRCLFGGLPGPLCPCIAAMQETALGVEPPLNRRPAPPQQRRGRVLRGDEEPRR